MHRFNFFSILLLVFTTALLLAGCSMGPLRGLHSDEVAKPDDDLKVLVWNAWRGGNEVTEGPEKILAVIRDSGADVVLMQESYDINGDRPLLGAWLAEELGWNQYQGQSPHLCVLTRYEIAETFDHEPWHGVGARLVHSSGREFLAWSIWLDYRAYIPYVIRDNPGISDEDLLKSEFEGSQRLPQAERLLERIEELGHLDSQLPLLVGGDWNTPSHLDWTRDSASVFKRRRDLDLPVSMLVESNDFSDVYRMLHPDPVHHPGITWSPMFRGTDEKEEGFDRIDRLYMHDFSRDWQLKPVSTTVFPLVWEDLSIPVPERKFPSDHSAVLLEMKFVEKPLGPGDPGYTTLEVAGWEVEATARKFLGDQVDVYFTLSKDGEKVASPRVWLIENEPAKVEVGDGQFVLRATVDAIPTADLTRVTIRIETEEKGHITRLPEAVIDVR
ncbi:MAG: hypothetical protein CBC13_10600 [Planctomycetia bacterium TMED53]|nr:MAG: hypothetical protein CBC13_10600 [Planctomycetia bacterium TMED53]